MLSHLPAADPRHHVCAEKVWWVIPFVSPRLPPCSLSKPYATIQIIFFGWGIYCLKEGDALELSLAIQPAIATAATAANNLAEETAIPAGPIHQPLAAAGLSPYEKDSCNDGGSDGSNDGRPESSPSSATFNPLYIHTFFRKPATKTSGGYGSRVAGSSGGGAAAAGREDDRSGSEARTTAAVAAVYSPPDPPRYSGVVRAIEARAIEIMGEEPQADGDGDVSVNMPPAVNGAPPLQHHQTETAASPGRSSGFFSAAESLELEEGGVGGGETGGFVCHDGGDDDSDGGSSETLWERVKQRAWNVVASPVIIALGAGIVVCLIEPLQDMLFHNPQAFLRPLGGAIQVGRAWESKQCRNGCCPILCVPVRVHAKLPKPHLCLPPWMNRLLHSSGPNGQSDVARKPIQLQKTTTPCSSREQHLLFVKRTTIPLSHLEQPAVPA